MKLKILALNVLLTSSCFASMQTNHHSDHHVHTQHHPSAIQCDFSNIGQDAKNPSQEIITLMHAPMMCTPWVESKNIETDYLSNMIPHHQGAILSSEALLKYTKDPRLKKIAQEIIQTQKQEIINFHKILKKLDKHSSQDYQTFAKESKEDMGKMMKNMQSNSKDVEIDYIKSMIAHHQGAINASKQVLKYTQNQEIIKVANEIISAQEREIKEFEQILQTKERL